MKLIKKIIEKSSIPFLLTLPLIRLDIVLLLLIAGLCVWIDRPPGTDEHPIPYLLDILSVLVIFGWLLSAIVRYFERKKS